MTAIPDDRLTGEVTDAAPVTLRSRHLLGIDGLEAREIQLILDTAEAMKEIGTRSVKKVPTLRGRTVVNLFFEPSTRTRTSFEVAEKRLSADTLSIATAMSSVTKGESLLDTVRNIEAMAPDMIVIRHASSGAPHLLARMCRSTIVNAGDGMHEHPTQALLDVHTLRQKLGSLEGRSIWIVGDVSHSRVARSNILAFRTMGAHVTVCGPPTLLPRGIEALGCDVRFDLDDLREADVVYALRMQHERMEEAFVPSLREYAATYQINGRRLGPRQVLMHPGPVNRGVELSGEVVDSPQAVITMQVKAGVVVRMAVLYELLAGVRDETAAPRPTEPQLA